MSLLQSQMGWVCSYTPRESVLARIQREVQLAGDHACNGVAAHTLKFCDLTQADLPRLEKALAESGIPLLHLEQDSLSQDRGQLATRVQAFLETFGFQR